MDKLLKDILTREIPVLFLGAGFSYGAKAKNTSDLPGGKELINKIITQFLKLSTDSDDYQELAKYPLPKICQYCIHKYDEKYLNDFFTSIFYGCIPANYHFNLSLYNWKHIYTTNIDDIVETVYNKNQVDIILEHFKRPSTIKNDKATIYYKIHGSVLNQSEGYTFSIDDYVNTMINSSDHRIGSLMTDIQRETFIFLGSEYDEIDIDYFLKLYEKTSYSSSRGKLIFINPKPSLFFKSKIEKLGGILIEWDNKKFLEFLGEFSKKVTISKDAALEKELKFSGFTSIKEIRDNLVKRIKTSYDSKLYEGFEPLWEDILADWDFRKYDIEKKISDIISLNNSNTHVFSLFGKGYVGKSTILKRLGLILLSQNYETYYFQGRNFNYFTFYKLIVNTDHSDFALIIDNAGYYYSTLKRLIEMVPKRKRLIIVTASRPFYHFKWRYSFLDFNFHEYEVEQEITDEYSKEILLKLNNKGYIGELKKIPREEDRLDYLRRNVDILSLLYGLTYGKGFEKRLFKELNPLLEQNDITKDLLIILSIFSKLEIPYLPLELTNLLTRGNSQRYLKNIENFIKSSFENSIELRNYFLSNKIIYKVPSYKIITLIKQILILISSQVNENEHSYWNEINAALTREKSLRKLLKLNNIEIKSMLYEIRNYYNDNFNYWIQLGIVEQREQDFSKALNHFKQAEALRPDSYMVKNAIGRNFLRQANSLRNKSEAEKYFDMGEEILVDLIENKEEYQARAYSTHCLLYEKLKYIEQFKIDVQNKELLRLFGYLKRILDKDENDIMANHINNYFLKFLQRNNRTNIIKIEFKDLERFKALFADLQIDFDNIFDDWDIN